MTSRQSIPPRTAPVRRRDLVVAAACGAFVAVMVGMSFAAVPLYNWFCRATGFGGTTQVAAVAPTALGERRVKIRFDANIGRGLPWRFEPEQTSIELRLGEVATVFYKITNQSARETVAQAAYNVTPPTAGVHFSKIECFCFSEQRLAPGETRDMPVVFFVEPALAGDPEMADLDTITLSYTFYPVREPAKVAEVKR
jgi:cytochrome c oxidase assembly protein subunit 11